jgi:hypothetical protein
MMPQQSPDMDPWGQQNGYPPNEFPGGDQQQYYQDQYGPNDGTVPPQYDGQQQSYYENEGYEVPMDGQEPYINAGVPDIPDIQMLAQLCAQAHPPSDTTEEALLLADESWDAVRDWMRRHSAEEVHAAAGQRDEAGKTALHFACQSAPPVDVVEVFLSIASDVVQWPDQFGWLPIHYACAYGSSAEVIKGLAEAYPESKTTVDRKGRTPLHFAVGNNNPNASAVVMILSSTGAASYADDNGMLVSAWCLFLWRRW